MPLRRSHQHTPHLLFLGTFVVAGLVSQEVRSEVQRKEDYETKSDSTGIALTHFMCHVLVVAVAMKCAHTDSRRDSPGGLIYME